MWFLEGVLIECIIRFGNVVSNKINNMLLRVLIIKLILIFY